ncbi:DUF222 domain-containing protein, partial [Paenarthrobacter sp. Z7-10]|uniref:DUF222 domain-containing protein n=1 Tax=Paenarthrobacter sp. Z7-10 TaxID=2787635 RepID=UPI0022A9249D
AAAPPVSNPGATAPPPSNPGADPITAADLSPDPVVAVVGAVASAVPAGAAGADGGSLPDGSLPVGWLSEEALALEREAAVENLLLDYLSACRKMVSWAQARQFRALAAFAARRPPVAGETPKPSRPERSGWAAGEIGPVLHVSHGTAEMLLCHGEDLTVSLPRVLDLYEAGTLDWPRVRAVLHGLSNAPRSIWTAVETAILPHAGRLSAQRLEQRVRREVEQRHPEPLALRHDRARHTRDVWFHPLPDGMAELGACLPAVQAREYYETIHAWALHARSEGQPARNTTPTGRPARAANEYRADAYMDLLDTALNNTTNANTNNLNGNSTNKGSAGDLSSTNTGNGSGGPQRRQQRGRRLQRGQRPWRPEAALPPR